LEKDLPLLPSSQAKKKGKTIQTLDGRTNHNFVVFPLSVPEHGYVPSQVV
jgi:hypothetical protein